MTPTEVLTSLGESGDIDRISIDWDLSEGDGKTPRFLTQREIADSLEWCGFGHEYTGVLTDTARLITRNPALLRLARHCKWSLFDRTKSAELLGWPLLTECLGPRSGLFYLLVGLGIVPRLREHHRSMGIPENITRDTCRQVRCYCETYQKGHEGNPGIQLKRISLLRHYVREPYVRIGRLEYWLKPNPVPPYVYQNIRSGQTLALAWPDQTVAQEGYMVRGESKGGYWHSTFTEDGSGVTGQPISPSGKVMHKTVTLAPQEWKRALGPGDEVLQIHIPSGEPVKPELIRASKNEAVAFFKQYFPATSPKAFVCTSWTFSDLLESMLPESSNLVQWLRELYLFPLPSPAHSGLSFIFPEDEFDPETASRDTTLERAILDHLAADKPWRIGGMFMLLEDLKHYGSQHYRSQWRLSDFSEVRN
jgi:hypothetical protein